MRVYLSAWFFIRPGRILILYIRIRNKDMRFNIGLRSRKTYVLMHKDIPVFSAEYNPDETAFVRILKIHAFDHVPYSAREENGIDLKRLNRWFVWRGITGYRVGLNRLLDLLDTDSPKKLLNEYYALSVSDHYWLKEESDPVTYGKISFFTHAYDEDGFGKAMFSLGSCHVEESALKTPNNTLAGYQKKAWFRRGEDLYLYKGGTFPVQLEPVHEKLASEIAKRLGIEAVEYTTSVYENQIVSVCKNMLDDSHDLLPSDQVLSLKEPQKDRFEYYAYLDILKEKGIENPGRAMDDLIVLDFIMMNTDRHYQNLGVIINCETMEWERMAPVFDTGTGLGCLRSDTDVDRWPEAYNYRLFNSSKITDNVAAYLINDISRYDFSRLDGIDQFYYEAMCRHRVISGIRDERIESQLHLLDQRIRAIRKIQMKAGKKSL